MLVSILVLLSQFSTINKYTPHITELVQNVSEISAPGVPGAIAVFGENAFPVVLSKGDNNTLMPVIAATTYGKGRVVAFGHTGYFDTDTLKQLDTQRLMLNVIKWCAQGKSTHRLGFLGNEQLRNHFTSLSFDAKTAQLENNLENFDIIFIDHRDLSKQQQNKLLSFVKNGSALVVSSTGWGWEQIHGKSITEQPLNQLLSQMGLCFTNATVSRTSRNGFLVTSEIPFTSHAGTALNKISQHVSEEIELSHPEIEQSVANVLLAAFSIPKENNLILNQLNEIRKQHNITPIPTAQNPITLSQPLLRISAALDTHESQNAPPESLTAHPASSAFPGEVPKDVQRVTKRIIISTQQNGWHSTGLYAPPGEKIVVKINEATANMKLQARIGAHTDSIWHHANWHRMPQVSRAFALDKTHNIIANSFGGLIYIDVPQQNTSTGINIDIENAIEAPLFMLGKTSLEDWREKQRHNPAPWAEIGSDKIVITVPSEAVRNLENPDEVAKFWDEVCDACAELATIPKKRARAERMVADVQISAGYMHAGYPIMTHLDVKEFVVDVERLRKQGSWGHFHEIGHNHQNYDWTFEGTGEVTVNLFTMYVYEKVLGQKINQGHNAISNREERINKIIKHIENGAPFSEWKNDPFLALSMYIQMIERFGWQPFKNVFALYKNLPQNERPRNDPEKRDQWMVRFSREVGFNLAPFFMIWGVPTSDSARDSISDLPVWLPEELQRFRK